MNRLLTGERRRRHTPTAAVRSDLVVVESPYGDCLSGFLPAETSPIIWDVTSLDKDKDKVTWNYGCNSSMNRTACRFPIFSLKKLQKYSYKSTI